MKILYKIIKGNTYFLFNNSTFNLCMLYDTKHQTKLKTTLKLSFKK